MDSTEDPSAALAAMGPMLGVFAIIGLAFAIASIVAQVVVLKKAGYSGWMFLLYLVPIVGIVWYFIFAFGEWPIQKKMKAAGVS